MRRVIGLFKGSSQYGAVRAHVDDLAHAFTELGFDSHIVDLEGDAGGGLTELFAFAQAGRLAFVHGMVGWGAGVVVAGHDLYQAMGVPFVHHMQDPPYFAHDRLVAGTARKLIAVHDAAYESYLQRVPALRGPRRLLTCGGRAPDAPLLPFEQRNIDVLVSMSVTPAAQLDAELAALPPDPRRLVRQIVEAALDSSDVVVHDVAFRLLAPRGIEEWFAAPERHSGELRFALALMQVAYQHVHARRRLRLAPQILALPAVIYGNGWEGLVGKKSRAQVRGPASFAEVLDATARARIALNVMPPVNDAPHDRTCYAMLAGAAYLTDPNAFFRREYRAGEEIGFYDLRTRTLADEVRTLLDDPARLAAMAEAGRAATAARHTWRHRAEELLAFVAECGGLERAA